MGSANSSKGLQFHPSRLRNLLALVHRPLRTMAAPARLNIVVFVSIALFLWYLHSGSSSSSSPRGAGRPGPEDVEMVVASMKKENVTWLDDFLLDWKKNIYVVDDPTAPLTVDVNKGREAMVFLTYIIDHYDRLPGTILFHHAERFQWHNDNPDYDALPLLQRLRLSHVENEGYVNLRCAWILGCPSEIKPHIDNVPSKQNEPITAKHVYKSAFEELFPGAEVPETIGVPCCSQFAVRREVVWSRKKEDYIRYRDWLLASPLGDDLSGRVLEYSWHSKSAHSSKWKGLDANPRASHLWQGASSLSQRRRVLLPSVWDV